jgi:hypothetical protein
MFSPLSQATQGMRKMHKYRKTQSSRGNEISPIKTRMSKFDATPVNQPWRPLLFREQGALLEHRK